MQTKQSQKVTAIYPVSYGDVRAQDFSNLSPKATKRNKKPTHTVMNPLVDAAKAVFTAVSEIQAHKHVDGVSENLQQGLVASITAFVVRAGQLGYSQELVVVARYMLSATVEEAMVRSEARANPEEDHRGTLMKTLGVEPLGSDQWKTLMGRLCSDPRNYIDILEFIYLCLRLDLKGHYQKELQGEEQRLAFTDELYQVISDVRGEASFLLSPQGLSHYVPQPVKKSLFKPWQTWLGTVVLVGVVYSFFAYSYFQTSAPLITMLQQAEAVLRAGPGA